MRTNWKHLSSAFALGILVWGNAIFSVSGSEPERTTTSDEAFPPNLNEPMSLDVGETEDVPVYRPVNFSIADPMIRITPKARRLSRAPEGRKETGMEKRVFPLEVTTATLEKAIPEIEEKSVSEPVKKVSREKISFGLEKMEIFQDAKTVESDCSSTSMSTTEPAPSEKKAVESSEYVVRAVATVRSVADIQTDGIVQVQFLEDLDDASVFDLTPPQNGQEPEELPEEREPAPAAELETLVQEAEAEPDLLVSETDERLLVSPVVTKTRMERQAEQPKDENSDLESEENTVPDVELPTLENEEEPEKPNDVEKPEKVERAEKAENLSETDLDVLTEEITRRAVTMISDEVVERAVSQATDRILEQVGKRIQAEKERRDSEITEERQRQREIIQKRIEAEVARRVAELMKAKETEPEPSPESEPESEEMAAEETATEETTEEMDEIPSDLPVLAEIPQAMEEPAQTRVGNQVEEPESESVAEPESPGFVKIAKKAKRENTPVRRSPMMEIHEKRAELEEEAGFVRIGGKKKKSAAPVAPTQKDVAAEEPEIPVYHDPEITPKNRPAETAPITAAPAAPQRPAAPEIQKLVLKPCGGVLLNTLYPVRAIRVQDRHCCDTVGLSPKQVSLIGKRPGQTRIEVFFNDPAIAPMQLDVTVSAAQGQAEILSQWCERVEKTAQEQSRTRVSIFLFQNRIFVKGYITGQENSHELLGMVQKDFLTLKKESPSLEIPQGKMILVNLLTVR